MVIRHTMRQKEAIYNLHHQKYQKFENFYAVAEIIPNSEYFNRNIRKVFLLLRLINYCKKNLDLLNVTILKQINIPLYFENLIKT